MPKIKTYFNKTNHWLNTHSGYRRLFLILAVIIEAVTCVCCIFNFVNAIIYMYIMIPDVLVINYLNDWGE